MKDLVDLFEPLGEAERRDMLAFYAESLPTPPTDLTWDVTDVRHDPECSDVVGIFLKFDASGTGITQLAATVGPGVRTMTRSLLAIICQGMAKSSRDALAKLSSEDLAPIAGPELMELRSRTVDYVARRFREAATAASTN